jgi:hypothetical protein
MTIFITGTVQLTLADLADQQVSSDLHVEIDLGATWPDNTDLGRLRRLAWRREGNVSLVSGNSAALGYVLEYLRERAGLDLETPVPLVPVPVPPPAPGYVPRE